VGFVKASVGVAARASVAEELWYDTRRWPAFVDGLAYVAKVEGDWPRSGRVVWDSPHGGRGRVVQRVARYEARVGQAVLVEDEHIRGTQEVAFEPMSFGCRVSLRLDYAVKAPRGGAVGRMVADMARRRPEGDSLRRTLARFRRELETPEL
jgi:hypothetical protein